MKPPYENKGHVSISLILCALGAIVFFSTSSSRPSLFAMLAGVGYIVWLLLSAAYMGDKHKVNAWSGLPDRTWAILVVLLLFGLFLFAFAGVDKWTDGLHRSQDNWTCLYDSALKIVTFAYREANPAPGAGQFAVLAELLSGVLLFLVSIPLLIARLADLADSQPAVQTVIQPVIQTDDREMTIETTGTGIRVAVTDVISKEGTSFKVTLPRPVAVETKK